ncbi:uncharacterized protein LOC116261156 isoform X2 [Nymphaea colorata]|uniref:uncharacterized protein LOC116261156 isoform X2 n=1 Tax=Nymphaea colorata TaxID=210225 RepID=UPI00129D3C4B|nr:uncharacterized protein LOC116261156 isoform X2 [Nymphaea colorata]
MKMFGWIHHKFRNNTGYELLAQCKATFDDDDKAVAPSSFGNLEREANPLLVKNAVLVEALLEEWHDGFLAMGTATWFHEESGEPEAVEVDGDKAKKRRFSAPLASGFGYKHGESMELVGSSQAAELGWGDEDMDTVALLHHVVQFLMQEEGHREMRVERIRTTLAELFSRRDSVYVPWERKEGRDDGGAMKEAICGTRPGSDVAAEPVGPKGLETEPSARLHKVQLTSKMLKRKIHPAMERENHLKDHTMAGGDEGRL